MELTTLAGLRKDPSVALRDRQIHITVRPDWIVAGEDRLSFTTVIRLVECCREYHWEIDISPRVDCLDSICKEMRASFVAPIKIGNAISISYRVSGIRRKGYSLRFEVRKSASSLLYARVDMDSVFYDPVRSEAVEPPETIRCYLRERLRSDRLLEISSQSTNARSKPG
jgi:acyl-CoA thioesterase FadM